MLAFIHSRPYANLGKIYKLHFMYVFWDETVPAFIPGSATSSSGTSGSGCQIPPVWNRVHPFGSLNEMRFSRVASLTPGTY